MGFITVLPADSVQIAGTAQQTLTPELISAIHDGALKVAQQSLELGLVIGIIIGALGMFAGLSLYAGYQDHQKKKRGLE